MKLIKTYFLFILLMSSSFVSLATDLVDNETIICKTPQHYFSLVKNGVEYYLVSEIKNKSDVKVVFFPVGFSENLQITAYSLKSGDKLKNTHSVAMLGEPNEVVLMPNEKMEKTININWRFPGLLEKLKYDDVILEWESELQPVHTGSCGESLFKHKMIIKGRDNRK
jgi:hypothetical protein